MVHIIYNVNQATELFYFLMLLWNYNLGSNNKFEIIYDIGSVLLNKQSCTYSF